VREANAESRTEKCSTQCEANAEANKCTRLMPRSGEVQEADAEERGSAGADDEEQAVQTLQERF
jgi:hypothetical protein